MRSKVDEFLQAEAQGMREAREALGGPFSVLYSSEEGKRFEMIAGKVADTRPTITISSGSGSIGSTGSIAANAIGLLNSHTGHGMLGQSTQNPQRPQTLRILIDDAITRKKMIVAGCQIDIAKLEAKKQKLEAALDIEMRDIDELRGY